MTNLTQLVLLCLSCHASQTYNLRRRLALESTDATYEVGQAVYIQVGSIFMESVVLRSMNTNTGKIIAVCPRSTAENPRGTVEYHLPTGEIREETLGMGSNRLRTCSKYEYFASTLRRAIPVKEELVEALKRGLDELHQTKKSTKDYDVFSESNTLTSNDIYLTYERKRSCAGMMDWATVKNIRNATTNAGAVNHINADVAMSGSSYLGNDRY